MCFHRSIPLKEPCCHGDAETQRHFCRYIKPSFFPSGFMQLRLRILLFLKNRLDNSIPCDIKSSIQCRCCCARICKDCMVDEMFLCHSKVYESTNERLPGNPAACKSRLLSAASLFSAGSATRSCAAASTSPLLPRVRACLVPVWRWPGRGKCVSISRCIEGAEKRGNPRVTHCGNQRGFGCCGSLCGRLKP